jgi:hypothetical protein
MIPDSILRDSENMDSVNKCMKRRKNVQTRMFVFSIMAIAVLMILQLLFSSANSATQISLIAVLGIIITTFILTSSFNAIKRIDGYMIFMALSFVFMFGEQLLFLLGIKMDDMWIYQRLIRHDTIYSLGFLTLYTYLLMHIGYSLTLHKRVCKVNIPDDNFDIRSRKTLMKAGIVISLAVLYPTVRNLIENIVLNMTMGYGERIYGTVQNGEIGADTILGVLANLMIPALLAMFIGKKKDSKWPWIPIAVYLALYMLSGSRINVFCMLCGILYANFLVHSSLTKRKLVIVLVVGFSIATLFSFVSHWRSNITSSGDEIMTQLIEDNPVFEIVKEMGFTSCATGAVIEHCPSDKPHLYGRSYLSGLIYILPNAITGNYYVKTPEVDSGFKDYINPLSGIGSSFIAEGYYNFGWWSLLLFTFYGYLLGVLCNKLERSVNLRNYPKIFLLIGIFCIVILYVRSDTRTFFRYLVWNYVPIYLYCKIIATKRKAVIDE